MTSVVTANSFPYTKETRLNICINASEIMNVPGCGEVLIAMRKAGHKLILVTFFGATRNYLKYKSLFNDVVFIRGRVYIWAVCDRYGIDVLIDNRQDLLSISAPVQSILLACERDMVCKTPGLECIHIAKNWRDVLMILPDIKRLSRVPYENIQIEPLGFISHL